MKINRLIGSMVRVSLGVAAAGLLAALVISRAVPPPPQGGPPPPRFEPGVDLSADLAASTERGSAGSTAFRLKSLEAQLRRAFEEIAALRSEVDSLRSSRR